MRILRPSTAALTLLLLPSCDAASTGQTSRSEICRVEVARAALPPQLPESSGLAFATPGNLLWSHNDSGGNAELVAFDFAGRTLAQIAVRGATNRDWEDMAIGPCAEGRCVYIGDIGDNAGERSEIVLYVAVEPSVQDAGTVPVRRYSMRYPDGPRDAEALFVTGAGEVYVVTKGGEGPIGIYRYPGPLSPGVAVLQPVARLSVGPVPLADRVTAADELDGRVVIRTYTSLLIYRLDELVEGADAEPARLDLTAIADGQGEGVALGHDGLVALTSEGFAGEVPGALVLLRCSWPDTPPDNSP